jgi:hypothetical protein
MSNNASRSGKPGFPAPRLSIWSAADKRKVSAPPALAAFGTYIVGRAPECDIVLDDPFASRTHIELGAHAGRLHLLDLGSKNDTYVNRLKVKETWLKDGDAIRLGDTMLQVRYPGLSGDPTPTRTTPDTISYKLRNEARSKTGSAVLALADRYGEALGHMRRKELDRRLGELLGLSPERARRRFDEFYLGHLRLDSGVHASMRYAEAVAALHGH